MKRKLALGVVVSSFFLWLAGRGLDRANFAEAFRGANYLYLVPGVAFTMAGHFSRSVRWRFVVAPIKDCHIGPLWAATAIAFMVNNLLPARLGEVVRALVIGRTEKISRSACFATIVYERVVDVFVLIALLWYCMIRISGPDWLSRSAGLLVAFNVVLLLLLWSMVRWRERFRAALDCALQRLPQEARQRVHASAASFIDGLGVLTRPSSLFPIVLFSLTTWGCAVLGLHFCVLALGLEVPALASVFLIVLISLGSMIPSAPAFLGTMQYACVVGLAVYGVDRSHALAFSTVYHATQFFPITIAGLFYAWRAHLGLAELSGRRTD